MTQETIKAIITTIEINDALRDYNEENNTTRVRCVCQAVGDDEDLDNVQTLFESVGNVAQYSLILNLDGIKADDKLQYAINNLLNKKVTITVVSATVAELLMNTDYDGETIVYTDNDIPISSRNVTYAGLGDHKEQAFASLQRRLLLQLSDGSLLTQDEHDKPKRKR